MKAKTIAIKPLIADGRGLMNRRAFINKLGMVAGGVALSVSWSDALQADSRVAALSQGSVSDDDSVFGSPGYSDSIPFAVPQRGEPLASDDPIFNIFVI